MAIDAALAGLALLTGLLSTGASSAGDVSYQPRDGWAFALIAVAAVPMLARSRAPVMVLLVTSCAVVALSASNYNEGILPLWLLVTAITVGARHAVRKVVAVGAVVTALLVLLFVREHDRGFDVATLGIQLALFSTAFTVGINLRSRRLRIQALEDRAAALEATRAEEAKRAVADERLRIAQELHDVLAHTLSVIAVQAGTGAHVIDAEPAEARRALENISTTSRASLTELRQLVGVLRAADDTQSYVPAPRLADLPRLADDVRAAGVPVDLVIAGTPNGVTPGVELVAYRIVQEALTNVLKHAGPARAHVRLDNHPGGVDIDVTDDGRGLAAPTRTGGHGLIGMRERVSMYGGTLQTGPRAGGGFRVTAHLPYGKHAS